MILQDTELGPDYSDPYQGYKAIADDELDPYADARKQLAQGDAEVGRARLYVDVWVVSG